MKIAIFGATSQIAKDLIIKLVQSPKYRLSLFSRNPAELMTMISPLCNQIQPEYLGYEEFGSDSIFDVIINFIGVGDPAKAKDMGADILSITAEYDDKILSYLSINTDCKYIFLSSGAVYGKDFSQPVDEDSNAIFNVNKLDSRDWYALSKFCAEAKHRSMNNKHIVDVRVFNYFSATQSFDTKFLMSDIVRSIVSEEVLLTSSDDIVRDFITPTDFYQLVESIIDSEPCNLAVDAYTAMPLEKLTLLSELKSKYGLKYEVTHNSIGINATGFKSNYYSLNRRAERFGYVPRFTSLDGVVAELDELLDRVSS